MQIIEYACQKLWIFAYDTYFLNWQTIAGSFATGIAMALIVMAIEIQYVGYRESGFRRVLFERSKSTVTDIVYFIIHTTGLITLFAVLASFNVPHFVVGVLRETVHMELGSVLPSWMHLVVYLILADFMVYWHHRLMHSVPALWKIHEFHHAAEEFNTLTVFREHPIDRALNSLATAIPGVLLGVPTGEFAIFVTIYGIIGYLKHSNIPWHGWIGRWIIQSPMDHRIHHSRLREHHNTNFASSFAIWDHLFGTYYNGANRQPTIGLDATYFNNSDPLSETVLTEARFFREVWTRVVRLARSSAHGRADVQ